MVLGDLYAAIINDSDKLLRVLFILRLAFNPITFDHKQVKLTTEMKITKGEEL